MTVTNDLSRGPWVVEVPIPASDWLSSNQRLHWAEKARRTSAIRTRAWALARAGLLTGLQAPRVSVEVAVHRPPRARRADAPNAAPSAKAAIDGLVDAGVIPDDSDKHVSGVVFRAGDSTGRPRWYGLTITITPDKENQS